jgi:D-arabinose 1-dehydrogenase-like Zn-dependent alcohol dehydrogenase
MWRFHRLPLTEGAGDPARRSARRVANFTRTDAREFLELAASIPIRMAIQTFPLEQGNEALRRLASGDLEATAVLVVGERDASGASDRSE